MHLVGVKLKQHMMNKRGCERKKKKQDQMVQWGKKKISANNDKLIYPAESLNAQGCAEAHSEKTD